MQYGKRDKTGDIDKTGHIGATLGDNDANGEKDKTSK